VKASTRHSKSEQVRSPAPPRFSAPTLHLPPRDGFKDTKYDQAFKAYQRVLTLLHRWVERIGNSPAIAVMGSTRAKEGMVTYDRAHEIGCRVVAELLANLITGGGPGIMKAVSFGARQGKLLLDDPVMAELVKIIGVCLDLPNEPPNAALDLNYKAPFFLPRLRIFVEQFCAAIIEWGGIGSHLEAIRFLDVHIDAALWWRNPQRNLFQAPIYNHAFSRKGLIPKVCFQLPHYNYIGTFLAACESFKTNPPVYVPFNGFHTADQAVNFADLAIRDWKLAMQDSPGFNLLTMRDAQGSHPRKAIESEFKEFTRTCRRLQHHLDALAIAQKDFFRVVVEGSPHIPHDSVIGHQVRTYCFELGRRGFDVVCPVGGGLLTAAAMGAHAGMSEYCKDLPVNSMESRPRLIRTYHSITNPPEKIGEFDFHYRVFNALQAIQVREMLGTSFVFFPIGIKGEFARAHTEQHLQFNIKKIYETGEHGALRMRARHIQQHRFLPRIHAVNLTNAAGQGFFEYITEQQDRFYSEGTVLPNEFSTHLSSNVEVALSQVEEDHDNWRAKLKIK
jgi:SLOG cluster4 family